MCRVVFRTLRVFLKSIQSKHLHTANKRAAKTKHVTIKLARMLAANNQAISAHTRTENIGCKILQLNATQARYNVNHIQNSPQDGSMSNNMFTVLLENPFSPIGF